MPNIPVYLLIAPHTPRSLVDKLCGHPLYYTGLQIFFLLVFSLHFFSQYFHPNLHASGKLIFFKHHCYHIILLLYSCLQSDISIHRQTFKLYTTITEISTECLLFARCCTLYRTPLEKPTAPSTSLASCNSACPSKLSSGDISP